MIEYHVDQGSPEWHALRAGRPTCSNFHLMRDSARLKRGADAGDYSADAKDEAFRLAIERISGEPLNEGFETWYMQRGHTLEPEARFEHEVQTGLIVERVGFVTTDDGLFGGSLDGKIGDDGCSEYKCFLAPLKLRRIHTTGDLSEVMDQCQGGLWITRRQWIDFCLYCPALAAAGKQLWRRRIYRDDDYIENLESDLMEFKSMIDAYERILRAPLELVEEVPAKLLKVEIGRRRLPAPLPAHMAAPAPTPKLTEFQRIIRRIAGARDAAEVDLILDGIGHLPPDEAEAVRIAAAQKISERSTA